MFKTKVQTMVLLLVVFVGMLEALLLPLIKNREMDSMGSQPVKEYRMLEALLLPLNKNREMDSIESQPVKENPKPSNSKLKMFKTKVQTMALLLVVFVEMLEALLLPLNKNREMEYMESQPVKENRMIGWQPVKETRRVGWQPVKENRGVGWQPVKETKMIGWQPFKETRRSDLDNLGSDHQVDSLKRVASESPPLNVAFTYRISEDTGTIPTGGTVQFDSKVFDSTESFNPKTGEFIAPGCGMYVFMLNIRSNQGRTCWVDIVKDGDSLATAFAESGPELQLGDTTFVTIYLDKGNTVWAKKHGYEETVCTIDFYSSFAGFRLF